jgi:hypothetical protein
VKSGAGAALETSIAFERLMQAVAHGVIDADADRVH